MVRPKTCAVERERAARKRNMRQIFHCWRFFPRIETRDAPILVWLFRTAQNVDQSIDEYVAADLSANVTDTQNVSARIEF